LFEVHVLMRIEKSLICCCKRAIVWLAVGSICGVPAEDELWCCWCCESYIISGVVSEDMRMRCWRFRSVECVQTELWRCGWVFVGVKGRFWRRSELSSGMCGISDGLSDVRWGSDFASISSWMNSIAVIRVLHW